MSAPSQLQSLESLLKKSEPTNTPSSSPSILPPVVAPSGTVSVSASSAGNSNDAPPTLPAFLTSAALAQGITTSNNGSTAGKLKFLLVSTHIQQFTGQSKVSYGIIRELAKVPFLSVTHFGFQKHPQAPPTHRTQPTSVRVLDAAAMEKPFAQGFGFQALPDVIRQEQPNVVMIYNDMSVVARFLEEIRKSGVERNFQIWIYVDQVQNTQLQGYLDILNRDADRIFAFTADWKKCLKDQGVTRPVDVLHHGFESDLFKPMNRDEARKKVGIPPEAFVQINLNRNQPRKRQDLLLIAFVELIVKFPTKPIFLMCICDKGEKGGWWLFEIFARELKLRGVPLERFGNRLMISSQDMVFRDEDINVFYNLADVGVSAAEGEGWGLCSFEQMGVGVPQVVPDVGGYKEFCKSDNSVLVKPKHRFQLPMSQSPVGGEVETVDPHDFCLGMETYLLDSEKRKAHGKKARETVLGQTWEKATETLIRRLKHVKEELDEE